MKRYFSFAIVVFVLVVASLHPLHQAKAAGWAELDSPTSHTLYGVASSSDTVYAVGTSGTVLYSSDNGLNWSEGDSNTTYTLQSVAAISSSTAVAVGQYGIVLRTTDGGVNWSKITPTFNSSSASTYGYNAVVMASSSVGYAVGDNSIMIKTTDGGASWTQLVGRGYHTEAFNSIMATSTSNLWVAGDSGLVFVSTDGGSTWTNQPTGTTQTIESIVFTDSTHGWFAGSNGAFYRTTNGGSLWTSVTVSGLDSGETINDVDFLDSNNGILAGSNGTLLQTDDSGTSWASVDTSNSATLDDVLAVSSNEWFGVGKSGAIYRYDATNPGKPSNFDVAGDNDAVTDTTPNFTWTAATDSESSIEYYAFKMDSGSYTNVGNTTSETYSTTLSNGSHTAYLYAVDLGGNVGSTVSVSFTIDSDSSSSTAPDVSTVTPTTALKDSSVTYFARVSDNGSIASCDLYVDGAYAKGMTLKTDVAYTSQKFSSTGTHTMYARCTDDLGNKTSGTSATVTISAGTSLVAAGSIIKIGCTGNVYVNDPCTAVYYYGVDGKRHPFPNEAVFKSWFNNYDKLVTLTSTAMSEISLGRTVTYRPGTALVKFSSNSVYAISYDSILRPVANEAIAAALFGSNWVSTIVIVNDVFFTSYRFGSMIESSSSFSASSVSSATGSIDLTF